MQQYLNIPSTYNSRWKLMATHNTTGKFGETLGTAYLRRLGYRVIEMNWRYSRAEVDLIAEKNGVLHFLEIKTRRTKKFGLPEEKVGKKKIQNLIIAAEQYVYLNPEWNRIQFDILAILMIRDQPIDYFLIEDVYI
ncbi:MAG: YraN family protein [Bacteroidota bacterium]